MPEFSSKMMTASYTNFLDFLSLLYLISPLAINVSLESASYSVVEGDTVKVCAIVQNGELEKSIELEISIVGQSGSDQEKDYKLTKSTFSLRPAQNQSCTMVEILNDNLVEGNETFRVILSSMDSVVTISSPSSAIITIEDIDGMMLSVSLYVDVIIMVCLLTS